jgi:hypothetical protein
MSRPSVSSVVPHRAVEGGRVAVEGKDFPTEAFPAVTVGEQASRALFASSSKIVVAIPSELDGGPTPIRFEDIPGETVSVAIGSVWATGLHQVDNPVFDREGNLFVTYSGSRGQEAPVSIFRVTPAGTREPFLSGIVNVTSMTFGPDGRLYASSRFAMSPGGELFVTGPTLGSYDHVHRIARDGQVRTVPTPFGRPQGLAFSPDGALHVIDALAGASGLYRLADPDGEPQLVVSGSGLVGVAFGPRGELVVASNDTVYRFE